MIPIKILDETAQLEAVVLGTAESIGPEPALEETYDPKSREQVRNGSYPKEPALTEELNAVREVLEKYEVKVYRPEIIENYNQVFARDIAFAIGEKLVVPSITKERMNESQGIQYIIDEVKDVIYTGKDLPMEGGDVIPWKQHLFVGYSDPEDFEKYTVARTSKASLDYLMEMFPEWEVRGFELKKSDLDPRQNVLHLDCCFQPLGKDKAVIYPGGFKIESDVEFLIDFFGKKNVFEVSQEEAYEMFANLFSINQETVVSDRSFTRLNSQLRDWGFVVEEIKYREVPKMGGSFRCSTLPLRRRYE